MKKMTIKDIAILSNTSKSTVSRYFNGGYIKDDTKNKIDEVIKKYNFKPNLFARLKAKKTNMVGIIVSRIDSNYISEILKGIDKFLSFKNYTSFIINASFSTEKEIESMMTFNKMNLDGIIFCATNLKKEHLDTISSLNIPVVVVGQENEKNCVINDDYNAGKYLAEKVIKLGYKDIVVVAIDEFDVSIGISRKKGMLDIFEKSNCNLEVIISDFSLEKSIDLIRKKIQNKKPEIIIGTTTNHMLAAYEVLNELDLKVLEDIAVTGFGGYKYREILKPKLSAIWFDPYKSGEKSAEMLIDIIENKNKKTNIVIKHKFIKGDSF